VTRHFQEKPAKA